MVLQGMVKQLAIKTARMVAVFALALFLPAGTLRWPEAWIFLVLFVGFSAALSVWLLRFNPDLLVERLTGIGKPDQKTWDKVFLGFMALTFFVWMALMGLDARFRWSRMPVWLEGVGVILLLCSFYLFFVTFRENSYLSPAVRVQKERAHTVVCTGPYSYVRHPMYSGFILFACGIALLLGSWYGLMGVVILVGVIAIRAVLEERVLQRELDGYSAYMTRVRFRFMPYVW